MALPEKLLAKLACPKCKGRITYLPGKDRLDCASCRLSYRVDNGVPVLLLDEAEKLN